MIEAIVLNPPTERRIARPRRLSESELAAFAGDRRYLRRNPMDNPRGYPTTARGQQWRALVKRHGVMRAAALYRGGSRARYAANVEENVWRDDKWGHHIAALRGHARRSGVADIHGYVLSGGKHRGRLPADGRAKARLAKGFARSRYAMPLLALPRVAANPDENPRVRGFRYYKPSTGRWISVRPYVRRNEENPLELAENRRPKKPRYYRNPLAENELFENEALGFPSLNAEAYSLNQNTIVDALSQLFSVDTLIEAGWIGGGAIAAPLAADLVVGKLLGLKEWRKGLSGTATGLLSTGLISGLYTMFTQDARGGRKLLIGGVTGELVGLYKSYAEEPVRKAIGLSGLGLGETEKELEKLIIQEAVKELTGVGGFVAPGQPTRTVEGFVLPGEAVSPSTVEGEEEYIEGVF
jgi:hypothetical protein